MLKTARHENVFPHLRFLNIGGRFEHRLQTFCCANEVSGRRNFGHSVDRRVRRGDQTVGSIFTVEHRADRRTGPKSRRQHRRSDHSRSRTENKPVRFRQTRRRRVDDRMHSAGTLSGLSSHRHDPFVEQRRTNSVRRRRSRVRERRFPRQTTSSPSKPATQTIFLAIFGRWCLLQQHEHELQHATSTGRIHAGRFGTHSAVETARDQRRSAANVY